MKYRCFKCPSKRVIVPWRSLLSLFALHQQIVELKKILSLYDKEAIKIFEEKKVRTVWDDEQEKWFFSIVDVVAVLTDSKNDQNARKYWNKLKQRLKEEENETVTNCHQLKMMASDGYLRRKSCPCSPYAV